ncbi:rod shape-determining protein RodA [Candidatus Dojkabacteria bacterium]|nr:rod shape-determining protein RodA [Candidatus Dojkabacteria bacterium]
MTILLIGLIIYFGIYFLNYSWLKEPKILAILFIGIIVLLVFVRFFTPEAAGTNRWIPIGPFNLQPAELAKIFVIVITSHILGSNFEKVKPGKFRNLRYQSLNSNENTIYLNKNYLLKFIKSAIIILPILLLVLIQPSFGNTIIIFAIWTILTLLFYPKQQYILTLGLIFITAATISFFIVIYKLYFLFPVLLISTFLFVKFGKITFISILVISIIGALSIPLLNYGWNNVLHDYQRARIENFLNPQSDPLGSGWQVRQSIIAIGSGRVFGKGLMKGTQSSQGILPYSHTDFIFASYAEQFGFVGSTILTILLLVIPVRLFILCEEVKSKYDKMILYGTGILLLMHILINIGMNLGTLPVTGIPLPFISYGGSSLLSFMIALGLVQNILKFNKDLNNFEKILPSSGFIKYT